MDKLRAQFAKDVRARMAALGMTQRELAEKLKTSQAQVGRFLTGTHAPTLDTVEKVAKVLGCVAEIRLRNN